MAGKWVYTTDFYVLPLYIFFTQLKSIGTFTPTKYRRKYFNHKYKICNFDSC